MKGKDLGNFLTDKLVRCEILNLENQACNLATVMSF